MVYKNLAKPIISKALQGFNGTIFAYGQTSSGKTHTMVGNDEKPGIIVLAVRDIFKEIAAVNDRQFLVRIGYIEIYNDKIFDLLDNRKCGLNIFEVDGNVVINQKDLIASSEDEVLAYFNIGNKCKRILETSRNARSSRSHTIFRITIKSQSNGNDIKMSNLYLVDLAGSEKPDLKAPSFNEGLHINKSLLVLGKIIRELAKKNSNLKKVNFRESKLTRILSPALGGNSLTSVICTVSPAALEETHHTLSFAQNAKNTKTYPTFNIAYKARKFMKKFQADTSSSSSLGSARSVKPSSKRLKSPSPFKSAMMFKKPKIIENIEESEAVKALELQVAELMKEKLESEEKMRLAKCHFETEFEEKNKTVENLLDHLQIADNENIKIKSQYEEALAGKDEEIEALENELSDAQSQVDETRTMYEAILQDSYGTCDILKQRHEEQMQAATEKIVSLEEEIDAYSKAAFQSEMTIRTMESGMMNKLKHETAEMEKEFLTRLKKFGGAIKLKNEKIKLLKENIEQMTKQAKVNQNEELRTYLKLEKHYGLKLQEACYNLEVLSEVIQDQKQQLEAYSEEFSAVKNEISQMQDLMTEATERERKLRLKVEEKENQIFELLQEKNNEMKDSTFNIHEMNPTKPTPPSSVISTSPESKPYLTTPDFDLDQTFSGKKVIRGGKCPYCKKSYLRKTALARHMQNKHLTHEQRFECDVCHDTYKTKESLKSHKNAFHREFKIDIFAKSTLV